MSKVNLKGKKGKKINKKVVKKKKMVRKDLKADDKNVMVPRVPLNMADARSLMMARGIMGGMMPAPAGSNNSYDTLRARSEELTKKTGELASKEENLKKEVAEKMKEREDRQKQLTKAERELNDKEREHNKRLKHQAKIEKLEHNAKILDEENARLPVEKVLLEAKLEYSKMEGKNKLLKMGAQTVRDAIESDEFYDKARHLSFENRLLQNDMNVRAKLLSDENFKNSRQWYENELKKKLELEEKKRAQESLHKLKEINRQNEMKINAAERFRKSGKDDVMINIEEALVYEEDVAAKNSNKRIQLEIQEAPYQKRIQLLKKRLGQNTEDSYDIRMEERKLDELKKHDSVVEEKIKENSDEIALNTAKKERLNEARKTDEELRNAKRDTNRSKQERDAYSHPDVKVLDEEIDSTIEEIGKEKGKTKHLSLNQLYRERLDESKRKNLEAISELQYESSNEAIQNDLQLQQLGREAARLKHETDQANKMIEISSRMKKLETEREIAADLIGNDRTVDQELDVMQSVSDRIMKAEREKAKLVEDLTGTFMSMPFLISAVREEGTFPELDPRYLMGYELEDLRKLDSVITALLSQKKDDTNILN